MHHIVLYCLLSSYGGLLAGIALMSLLAMAAKGPAEATSRQT